MLKNLDNLTKLTFYEKLFLLFPVVLILRPVTINIFLILVIFILIYELFKKNYLNIIKEERWIWFFLFFIFYSIFKGFFAKDFLLAVTSGISLFKFLFFSLFIFLCIKNLKNLNLIIKFWIAILIFLCIDTLFQYIFLTDLFNFPKQGLRLTGPFGRHQIIGAYLSYISIPLMFYFFSRIRIFNFQKKFLLFLIYFLLFITIAITGERLAFIIFLSGSLVIFFSFFRIKYFVFLFFLIFGFILVLYYFNMTFNSRINEFYSTIVNFKNSGWGRLIHSGYLVFKSNILFGVGLKNYATVCDNQIIDPWKDIVGVSQHFCDTHPHHFYLEILSESGIIGFLLLLLTFGSFFSSIIHKINKLKNNLNFNEFKGLLYGNLFILFIYFWPIKTSGRFFTTFNGSFFWLNLGMALLITKDFYKKNK
jgi:O-antigen ligase